MRKISEPKNKSLRKDCNPIFNNTSNYKKKLACPFFLDPQGIRKPDFPSCFFPGFDSVSRLKEHLYRQHKIPQHYCYRCCSAFSEEDSLREHQRAPQGCQIREHGNKKGLVTFEQERELRSKKRSRQYQSEDEKWKDVYRIIFPEESIIPSPYLEVEASGRFTKFQVFSKHNVDRILNKRLKRAAEEDERFQDEQLKTKMMKVFRDVQSEVFDRFEHCQSEGSPETDGGSPEIPNTSHRASPSPGKRNPDLDNAALATSSFDLVQGAASPTTASPRLEEPNAPHRDSEKEATPPELHSFEALPQGSHIPQARTEELSEPLQTTMAVVQDSDRSFAQNLEEPLGFDAEFAGISNELSGCNSELFQLPDDFDSLFNLSSDVDWSFSFNPDCGND